MFGAVEGRSDYYPPRLEIEKKAEKTFTLTDKVPPEDIEALMALCRPILDAATQKVRNGNMTVTELYRNFKLENKNWFFRSFVPIQVENLTTQLFLSQVSKTQNMQDILSGLNAMEETEVISDILRDMTDTKYSFTQLQEELHEVRKARVEKLMGLAESLKADSTFKIDNYNEFKHCSDRDKKEILRYLSADKLISKQIKLCQEATPDISLPVILSHLATIIGSDTVHQHLAAGLESAMNFYPESLREEVRNAAQAAKDSREQSRAEEKKHKEGFDFRGRSDSPPPAYDSPGNYYEPPRRCPAPSAPPMGIHMPGVPAMPPAYEEIKPPAFVKEDFPSSRKDSANLMENIIIQIKSAYDNGYSESKIRELSGSLALAICADANLRGLAIVSMRRKSVKTIGRNDETTSEFKGTHQNAVDAVKETITGIYNEAGVGKSDGFAILIANLKEYVNYLRYPDIVSLLPAGAVPVSVPKAIRPFSSINLDRGRCFSAWNVDTGRPENLSLFYSKDARGNVRGCRVNINEFYLPGLSQSCDTISIENFINTRLTSVFPSAVLQYNSKQANVITCIANNKNEEVSLSAGLSTFNSKIVPENGNRCILTYFDTSDASCLRFTEAGRSATRMFKKTGDVCLDVYSAYASQGNGTYYYPGFKEPKKNISQEKSQNASNGIFAVYVDFTVKEKPAPAPAPTGGCMRTCSAGDDYGMPPTGEGPWDFNSGYSGYSEPAGGGMQPMGEQSPYPIDVQAGIATEASGQVGFVSAPKGGLITIDGIHIVYIYPANGRTDQQRVEMLADDVRKKLFENRIQSD